MKTTKQRFLIIAVVLTVVFAVIGSAVFSALFSSHDCHSDDCVVCEQLASCDNILNNTSSTGMASTAAAAVFVVVLMLIRPKSVSRRADTPVTLKTELLN